MNHHLLAWGIAAAAICGVILRPFKWPEAVWATAGALLIVGLGLLPVNDALHAVAKGTDVYLFLIGMMLLSEVARREGLFDWIAVIAVNHAHASPRRLFALVYVVGVVVTAFLSNDATAVVLTPAVFAVAKKADARALPFLFVCAFVANAASFVLPISNPANLVLYAHQMPSLGAWLARFAVPSLVSVTATYALLRWSMSSQLMGACNANVSQPALGFSGRVTLGAIVATAVVLLLVSALDIPLGLPTAVLGVLTAAIVLVRKRGSPWPLLKGVSWGVLPLVAGLFVLVEMLNRTGVIETLASVLIAGARQAETATAAMAGIVVAVASNLINNLPAGLIASSAITEARSPQRVIDSLMIGVDLGPNLSITGSLATILWLTAIRREGEDVRFWTFLRIGLMVMPPALILTIAARLLVG